MNVKTLAQTIVASLAFAHAAGAFAQVGVDARLRPVWECRDAVADATTTAKVSRRRDGRSFTVAVTMYDAWRRATIPLARVEGAAYRDRIPGVDTWMPIENYFGKDAVTGDEVDLLLTPDADKVRASGTLSYVHAGDKTETQVTCWKI